MRVAVVTGASSGIGKSAALTLAAKGWHVFGVGRDPARIAAASREIAAAARNGGGFEMLKADLANLSDAARVARDISDRVGHVDVLLANAGGPARERRITPRAMRRPSPATTSATSC